MNEDFSKFFIEHKPEVFKEMLEAFERSISPGYLEAGVKYIYLNNYNDGMYLKGHYENLNYEYYVFTDIGDNFKRHIKKSEIWFKIKRADENAERKSTIMPELADTLYIEYDGNKFCWERLTSKVRARPLWFRDFLHTPKYWPRQSTIEVNCRDKLSIILRKSSNTPNSLFTTEQTILGIPYTEDREKCRKISEDFVLKGIVPEGVLHWTREY